MESWNGLIVPTYFINHVVHRRVVGPCVQLFFGLAASDADKPLPEFSAIWPAQDALRANAETFEFLRMQDAGVKMLGGPRRWLS
jgi:hypothetical protein